MPVTVLGGGNTAFSMAANLALAGHQVLVAEDALGPGEGVEGGDLDEQQPGHALDEGLELVVDVVGADAVGHHRLADLGQVDGLAAGGAEIANDVVLNQVLVRFAGGDEVNRAAVAAVQRDGTCWLGGTQWNGDAVMRVSFSNWSTTDEDVDRSIQAILRAAGAWD